MLQRRSANQVLLGFAAHSGDVLTQAEAKVEKITVSPEGTAGKTEPLEIE